MQKNYEPSQMSDGDIRPIPLKKKQYGKSPGSSPEVRAGIEDVHYVQKYGKGPLIEKRDNK
jgi:hypothetical protein